MRAVLLALFLTATPAVAADPDPASGQGMFLQFCAACHGTDAKGDGPMAEILTVAPPDLTQLAARNDGAFPVFRVIRQIDGRDPLLAHGGEMPLFGRIFDFPDAAIAAETGQPIITAQPIADIAAWLISVQTAP